MGEIYVGSMPMLDDRQLVLHHWYHGFHYSDMINYRHFPGFFKGRNYNFAGISDILLCCDIVLFKMPTKYFG